MKHLVSILSSLFALAGCAPETDAPVTNSYFDLAGFTRGQIKRLDSLRPMVDKRVVSGEKRETKKLNAIDWQRELDLFVQADLNKPAYRNSYVTKKSGNEVEYRAKAGEDVPVKHLKVRLDSPGGRVLSAEALVTSENYLYQSSKRLQLRCRPDQQGGWLLGEYTVSGFQKLVFLDQEPFEIVGTVR